MSLRDAVPYKSTLYLLSSKAPSLSLCPGSGYCSDIDSMVYSITIVCFHKLYYKWWLEVFFA